MAKEHTLPSAVCSVTGKVLKVAGYTGAVLTGVSALLEVKVTTDLTYTLDVPIDVALNPGKLEVSVGGAIGPAHASTSGDWGHGNYTNSGLLGGGSFNFGSWSGGFDLQEVLTNITLQIMNTAEFGKMSLKDNIHMQGNLTGTVLSIESASDLLKIGPVILGSASLTLIASGHLLDDIIAEKKKKTVPTQTVVVDQSTDTWEERIVRSGSPSCSLEMQKFTDDDDEDLLLAGGAGSLHQQRIQRRGGGRCGGCNIL